MPGPLFHFDVGDGPSSRRHDGAIVLAPIARSSMGAGACRLVPDGRRAGGQPQVAAQERSVTLPHRGVVDPAPIAQAVDRLGVGVAFNPESSVEQALRTSGAEFVLA